MAAAASVQPSAASAGQTASDASYADVASHQPAPSNAIIDGPFPPIRPDVTDSSAGVRRRRSDRLARKGSARGADGVEEGADSGEGAEDMAGSSLGLNLSPPDRASVLTVQDDSHDENKDEVGGAGKSKGKKKGSRIDLSISNARKRVAEGLKSPLLGGMKLDEIGEKFSKNVEIKFAPLNIPPHRRLQTFAVAFWALLLPICLFFFFLFMSIPPLWVVMVPYLIWIQFDQAPDKGGRPTGWMRRLFLWKYFAEYYPCSVVKEANLPPDRPYLFGYHPHGIIGMGAFATFGTEGTDFSTSFPGILPHLLTLESNFKIPFYRDVLLSLGICSVSKTSCRNILAKGPGNAITIVIGGAAESLSAHPGTADLTLKKRFGFVKIAIREGADLVPVFSFGENDIYDQLANKKGSFVYSLQKRFQKLVGFTLPLFYGRGIFNYSYGLMPFRHPIVSVIGRPIHVERDPDPTDEKVQEVQQQYIDELMSIWDKYKDVYAKHRTKELTLVE